MTTLNLSLPKRVEEQISSIPEEELHSYVGECLARLVVEKKAQERLAHKHPILKEAEEIYKTRQPLLKAEAGARLAELIGSFNER